MKTPMARLCIDMCSGLGGFSRAFKDRGWEVITIDNNPIFKPTICADITTLTAKDIEQCTTLGDFTKYDVIVVLASPPCEHFSLANYKWPRKGIKKALEIVGACLELIAEIKPHYWLLENPKGRLTWFLGKPTHSIKLSSFGWNRRIDMKSKAPHKPTHLWGTIPLPLLDEKTPTTLEETYGYSAEHRAKRGELPYALSETIVDIVENLIQVHKVS